MRIYTHTQCTHIYVHIHEKPQIIENPLKTPFELFQLPGTRLSTEKDIFTQRIVLPKEEKIIKNSSRFNTLHTYAPAIFDLNDGLAGLALLGGGGANRRERTRTEMATRFFDWRGSKPGPSSKGVKP